MKKEEEFYTTHELINEPWFPIRSHLTVKKLIESGDLEAVNISTGKLKRYRITKKSALDFIVRRKAK